MEVSTKRFVKQSSDEHPSMYPNQIRRRAKALAIPEGIRDHFISDVLKWAEHSGEEWTVGRLKAFTTYLTAKFAGQTPAFPEWIAVSRSKNLKGSLGALERYALSSTRNFKKAQKLLRVSTAFVSTYVTPKQDSKFFESAMRPCTPVPVEYHNMMVSAVRAMRKQGLILNTRMKASGHILTSRRRPEHVEESLLKDLESFWSHETAKFVWLTRYHKVLRLALGDLVFTGRTTFNYGSNVLTVGEIKLSQEPGYKGRIYASPQNHLQYVLEPMKQALGNVIQGLPWDCTFDQKKGHPYIQRNLKSHKTVWCFDLSDATNNFPLELQESLLNALFTDDFSKEVVAFFSEVSRAPWKVKIPGSQYDETEMRFTRGQPLGLGPSFFSFDLCHGALLFALNGYQWGGDFFVLGDDVIILSEQLADAYAQALADLDLPWSKDKTLVSNTVAEFAGYLFFADSTPLLKPKWKRLKDSNILSSLELWGPGLLDEVASEWRDFLRWYVQQPFGFNWTLTPDKPDADSLWDGYLDLFFAQDEDEPEPVEYETHSLYQERLYRNSLGASTVWKHTRYDASDRGLKDSVINTEYRADLEAAQLPEVLRNMYFSGLPVADLHPKVMPSTRLRPSSPLLSRAKKERSLRNKRYKFVTANETNPVRAIKAKIEAHDTQRSALIAETLSKLVDPVNQEGDSTNINQTSQSLD